MNDYNDFKGVFTALVTPFINEKICFKYLERLLLDQIEANIDGVILGGSTGEGHLIQDDEYQAILNFAIKICSNKIKIIGTCNANSMQSAIQKFDMVEKSGAQAIMCTVPYYLKPSQEGILAYFNALDKKSNLPIIIYNNPSRTCVNLKIETIKKLDKTNNIKALKDSTEDVSRPLKLTALNIKTQILCGDDLNFLSFYVNGASGIVSVASNIFPNTIKKIYNYCCNRNYKSALAEQTKLIPLYELIAIYGNPRVIKYCLHLKNSMQFDVRLPLVPISEIEQKSIKHKLVDLLNSID